MEDQETDQSLKVFSRNRMQSHAAVTCELIWLRYLFKDIKVSFSSPAVLHCNQAALQVAANLVFHEPTKHIKIDCHVVTEKIQVVYIITAYVTTKNQIEDVSQKHWDERVSKSPYAS